MLLVYYILLLNIAAFFLYQIDKRKAEFDKWRVSERTLILVAVLGGALGAWIAMKVFHHKTKKKKFSITVPVFICVWLLICIFSIYQNFHLVVTYYGYSLGESRVVKNGSEGNAESDSDTGSSDTALRIVQISDLHNQFFGYKEKSLLGRIQKLNPDIIVVTGDVVDFTHTNYTLAEDFFEGAVKIAPTYYITGNHEEHLKGDRLNEFITEIQKMGVTFLDDKTVQINDGKCNITLAGVAEESLNDLLEDKDIFAANSDNTSETSSDNASVKILLAHEPEHFEAFSKTGADIVMTGHVHGGQIIIPGKGGLLSPDFKFFPKHYEGFYACDDTDIIISRGLGNSVVPVRINNYPEIVVLDISE